jgi:hypothetical protein
VLEEEVVVVERVVDEVEDVVTAEPDEVEVVDEVVVVVPSLEPGDVGVVEELVEDNLVLDEEDVVRMVEEELDEVTVDNLVVDELGDSEVEGNVDELDDGVLSETNVALLISEDP